MKYYAGVGSRETPPDVLKTMLKIGRYLAVKGYTLRSGGAKGADTALRMGVIAHSVVRRYSMLITTKEHLC